MRKWRNSNYFYEFDFLPVLEFVWKTTGIETKYKRIIRF